MLALKMEALGSLLYRVYLSASLAPYGKTSLPAAVPVEVVLVQLFPFFALWAFLRVFHRFSPNPGGKCSLNKLIVSLQIQEENAL
jgi:hypothetical protein